MIKSIRNFEIKELIATGGMAAIYKAVQTSLDRVVAIKVLHGHLAQDPNFIQRFEREAKAAANLKHENVVNIIDFGKEEEVYFIAMEYVEGRALKDLIAQIKVFPLEVICTIAASVCRGLSHAHQKGVIHRDIKPANILIGFDGTIKIADFGLAQAQDLTSITVTGAIVGTPAYMSPEQAAGRRVDNRSDLFSLGIILYEMLTGEKPFPGDNYSSVITRILTVTPKCAVEMNPLVPVELSKIVEKMMEKDVDKRFSDVDGLLVELETYAKRNNISISRKHIDRFVNEPDSYIKDSLDRRKREHFDRGVYYMNLGLEKIDDAIDEFTKVIFLDPGDLIAREYVEKLKAKKEKTVKKPEVKPEQPVVTKEARPKKKAPVLPVLVGVGVIALIIVLFTSGLFSKPSSSTTPSVYYGSLALFSRPEGATVFVDGQELTYVTPTRLDSLAPGRHEVVLTLTGYKIFTDTVEIMADSTRDLLVALVKEKITTPVVEKFGGFYIRTEPAGAVVSIDGREIAGRTPCRIDELKVGTHRISISKDGYQTRQISRAVVSGRVVNINVKLTRKDAATPTQYGYLKLNVNPWAKVYIDDRYIETTPIASPIKIPAGRHVIKLTNPNFKTWTETIDFSPNQTVNRTVHLQPGEGYLKITVNPWADLYIDNEFVGTTPISKLIILKPGKHRLKLVNPNFETFEDVITIISEETLKKHINLKKE